MRIEFTKYQGTGNDFIMIDGREETVIFSEVQVKQLCDRRFGIGADGIIILKNHPECDFEMDYYNADGTKSFCGNGSRCAQAFALELEIIKDESYFLAIDGFHKGKRVDNNFATHMADVNEHQSIEEDYFIHTGSPHYIKYVEDTDLIDVVGEGRAIRNSDPYRAEGTNVNFVNIGEDGLKVRTYERGVEAETYSCGTGVTAAAISYQIEKNRFDKEVKIETKGGNLSILLNRNANNSFDDIWLVGPAEKVFSGSIAN